MQRLPARDARSMTLFYQQYRVALHADVLRIVHNRQSAEDVVQEGVLKVWQSIASYDAARGCLFTWAAKICCNTAIDHVRTGRFRLTARTASLDDAPGLAHAVAGGFQPEHLGVPELLHGLHPEYRQVMELVYLQDYLFFAPATTCWARTAAESTTSRCKPVAFCTWATTCGHTPAWRQGRKRAYTVCQGPNRSAGKSRHETPQRAHPSTACSNKPVSLAVGPGDWACSGKSGENRFHWGVGQHTAVFVHP